MTTLFLGMYAATQADFIPTSIGKMTSVPYTMLKGGTPMAHRGVVRKYHKILGNSSTQLTPTWSFVLALILDW